MGRTGFSRGSSRPDWAAICRLPQRQGRGDLGDRVSRQDGQERVDVEAIAEFGVRDVVGKWEEQQWQSHQDRKPARPLAVDQDQAGEAEHGRKQGVKLVDEGAISVAGARPEAISPPHAEIEEV